MKKKTIHILGVNGNMGRRYASILKYLDIGVTGHDAETYDIHQMQDADGFIIATPTEDHLRHCQWLFQFHKPILCEKPLTKSMADLDKFEDQNRPNLCLLSVVNQYVHLIDRDGSGETYYEYFNSGKDGLFWDCINIIGLSKTKPKISNVSPYWSCKINGVKLNLSQLDGSYVKMVESWVKNPVSNYVYARIAHEKTMRFIRGGW